MEIVVYPEAWEHEYGTAPESIARDVEDYILTQLTQSPAAEADALEIAGYAVNEAP
jgi:hypothetical protein